VRGLIGFAREFDMVTIAESVETEAEAIFLAESGVECLQGYLFGTPTVRPPWQHKSRGP
jgi:EAL domain-containing protein (putative c-di-GMP-specific phosphodiesterase class I)